MLKKIKPIMFLVVVVSVSSCFDPLNGFPIFRDNNECPQAEKWKEMNYREKLMYGEVSSQYPFEFVKAMPKNQTSEIPAGMYKSLRDNALDRINKRRSVIKKEIDAYKSYEQGFIVLLLHLYLSIVYYFDKDEVNRLGEEQDKLRFCNYNNHYYDLIDAYNNLFSMAVRLKRSYLGLDKFKELCSVGKKQKITINRYLSQELLQKYKGPCCEISRQVCLKDLILAVSWSNGISEWKETQYPHATIKLQPSFGNIGVGGEIGDVLYNAIIWRCMYEQDWIRCAPGSKRQPVYTRDNFIESKKAPNLYKTRYGPYFREILSENEKQEGSLWQNSKALPSDEWKTGSKDRIVWFKFPFESGYDLTINGCYNPAKKSRYQFKDGTIMDNKTNSYLAKDRQKPKKLLSGKTAQDATWALASDARDFYEDAEKGKGLTASKNVKDLFKKLGV